jgi:hypothetical protein
LGGRCSGAPRTTSPCAGIKCEESGAEARGRQAPAGLPALGRAAGARRGTCPTALARALPWHRPGLGQRSGMTPELVASAQAAQDAWAVPSAAVLGVAPYPLIPSRRDLRLPPCLDQPLCLRHGNPNGREESNDIAARGDGAFGVGNYATRGMVQAQRDSEVGTKFALHMAHRRGEQQLPCLDHAHPEASYRRKPRLRQRSGMSLEGAQHRTRRTSSWSARLAAATDELTPRTETVSVEVDRDAA